MLMAIEQAQLLHWRVRRLWGRGRTSIHFCPPHSTSLAPCGGIGAPVDPEHQA